MVINDHIVNETPLPVSARHYLLTTRSAAIAPTISVPGDFHRRRLIAAKQIHDQHDHLEFQNMTTMSAGAHAIKFGTRLRDNRDANCDGCGTSTAASPFNTREPIWQARISNWRPARHCPVTDG